MDLRLLIKNTMHAQRINQRELCRRIPEPVSKSTLAAYLNGTTSSKAVRIVGLALDALGLRVVEGSAMQEADRLKQKIGELEQVIETYKRHLESAKTVKEHREFEAMMEGVRRRDEMRNGGHRG